MTQPILRFFQFQHLPEPLRRVSEPFSVIAQQMSELLPVGPESTVCLRKLLEAKDAAVRAALPPSGVERKDEV